MIAQVAGKTVCTTKRRKADHFLDITVEASFSTIVSNAMNGERYTVNRVTCDRQIGCFLQQKQNDDVYRPVNIGQKS